MSKEAIYFDIDRCIGCFACQLACKQENELAPHSLEGALSQDAPLWRSVMEIEHGEFGQETVHYISLSCMHCADAPCVMACPTGALAKDSEDGRVLVDKSKCIGCRMCLQVCPFGIPQYGRDDLMQKCDLCLERVKEQGGKPACVAACTSKALRFMDTNQMARELQEEAARKCLLVTDEAYSKRLW